MSEENTTNEAEKAVKPETPVAPLGKWVMVYRIRDWGKDLIQKIKEKGLPIFEKVREKVNEKWDEVDEEKRKLLLITGIIVLALVVVGFIWNVFFAGKVDNTEMKKDEVVVEITETNLGDTKTTVPSSDLSTKVAPGSGQSNSQLSDENRVLPALNTMNLESWSGLKSDRYEMKKRGQIKTIPQRIKEVVPGL